MLDAALAIDTGDDGDGGDAVDDGGIDLVLTVRNGGDAPETLRFRTGQRADFTAYRTEEGDEDGEGTPLDADPAWRYGTGRMFTQVLGSETLEPGETATYEATWGDPPAGRYRIVGEVTAEEYDLAASTVVRVSP